MPIVYSVLIATVRSGGVLDLRSSLFSDYSEAKSQLEHEYDFAACLAYDADIKTKSDTEFNVYIRSPHFHVEGRLERQVLV